MVSDSSSRTFSCPGGIDSGSEAGSASPDNNDIVQHELPIFGGIFSQMSRKRVLPLLLFAGTKGLQ